MCNIKTFNCNYCGKEFTRNISIYRKEYRKIYLDGNVNRYCSDVCFKNDKASHPFSWYYSSIKIRHEKILKKPNRQSFFDKISFNISLEYLEDLWKEQDGKCYYSDHPLQIMRWNDMNLTKKIRNNIDYSIMEDINRPTSYEYASVDRIDNRYGYIIGNIQFTSRAINLAKSDKPELEFINYMYKLTANDYIRDRNIRAIPRGKVNREFDQTNHPYYDSLEADLFDQQEGEMLY